MSSINRFTPMTPFSKVPSKLKISKTFILINLVNNTFYITISNVLFVCINSASLIKEANMSTQKITKMSHEIANFNRH